MKYVAAVLVACSFGASAMEILDNKIAFDERERALIPQCAAQGGCAVISRAELEAYVMHLRQAWMSEVQEAFGAAVEQKAAEICKKTI